MQGKGKAFDRSRWSGLALTAGFRALDSAASRSNVPFSDAAMIRPNLEERLFNVSHYGIMIPNLPEPFCYFSLMAILGTAGNQLIDTDHMLVDRPSRNATQVSGTAADGTGQFASYSMARDCVIHPDGSVIQFGTDVRLSGLYPKVRLEVTRETFGLDIVLSCYDNVTWFADTPMYKHIGLMADYQGHLVYQGQQVPISGACTYEYFKMVGPYGFVSLPLPHRRKVPMDFFSYQIVDVDNEIQLMLAKVGMAGETLLEAAWIRRRGSASVTFAENTQFEVTVFEDEPRVAPDGRQMLLPKAFVWNVLDDGETIARIEGRVDTPFTYGLCSGYVGGYAYHGELEGRSIKGRAYIEYVDTGLFSTQLVSSLSR